jgi:hypothetical protein
VRASQLARMSCSPHRYSTLDQRLDVYQGENYLTKRHAGGSVKDGGSARGCGWIVNVNFIRILLSVFCLPTSKLRLQNGNRYVC